MSRKKFVDWEFIEQEYRANIKSIAQIARESGAASSTIRSRAKAAGWTRDLSTRIKLRADEYVHQESIKAAIVDTQASAEVTVEENAKLTAGVRLAHRRDIAKARQLTQSLFEELEGTIGAANRERLDALLELVLDAEDGIASDDGKAIAAYKRAVSLSSAVSNMRNLADAMTKFVTLERQAWGLDNFDDKPHDPLTALLTELTKNHSNGLSVVHDDPEYDNDSDGEPLASPANTLAVADDDCY